MSVPSLRFTGFNEVWKLKNVNELLVLFGGNSFQSIDSKSSGVRWLKIANVGFGKTTWDTSSFLPNSFIKEYSRYTLDTGDIVMALTRPIIRNELKIAKLQSNDLPILLNQRVAKLITNEGISNSFIYHLLRKRKVVREIENLISGTDPPNIGNSDMEKLKVFIPDELEQKKIGDFFNLLDQKTGKQLEKVEQLEELKKGMMQKVFSRELRFKDENGGEFPEWEEKKLGDFTIMYSGGTPDSKNAKYYKGSIPFIRSGEIYSSKTELFINEEAINNSSAKMVAQGDLLMAIYGATSGEISISKIEGAINQAILCIKSSQSLDYIRFYWMYQKERIISAYLQGGQGNLSAGIVKKVVIPLPCIQEQLKISNTLKSIEIKINKEVQRFDNLVEQKRGFMQQMFV